MHLPHSPNLHLSSFSPPSTNLAKCPAGHQPPLRSLRPGRALPATTHHPIFHATSAPPATTSAALQQATSEFAALERHARARQDLPAPPVATPRSPMWLLTVVRCIQIEVGMQLL
ncbi:hypothetical protein BS78_05G066300 [Paspalum vaginatum]|nr:hypothetical protein BS78_05G066300 [Paspalum vaginatum]